MYSLGATVYQMVTGKVPFGELEPMEALRSHIEDTLPALSACVGELPDSFSFVVEKLMMKSPENRFPDWAAALHSMQRELSGNRIFVRKSTGGASTIAPPTAHRTKKTYRIRGRTAQRRPKVRTHGA